MSSVTVEAESGSTTVFGTDVSDIQSNVSVSGDKITGTLKYLAEGELPTTWGAGNFLVLKFSDFDADAEKVLVGLEPSYGGGLVDILPDPDKNGAFKITDKDHQKFVVKSIDGDRTRTQYYDLSGLTVQGAGA